MKVVFYRDDKKIKVQKNVVDCRVEYDKDPETNRQYLITDRGIYYMWEYDRIVIYPDKRESKKKFEKLRSETR